ncbi:hypothetical protein OBBRIDRAFT_298625 [Obba rivulosa]|uniref:Uncharacterized protein n=1 Tax=Obba rivulosa TaxID=1052685 RepID=A0A8E2AJ79_9APHY|nr:hypothetical protein OBBRIDRAFT_298625 [Obba rivulosa]
MMSNDRVLFAVEDLQRGCEECLMRLFSRRSKYDHFITADRAVNIGLETMHGLLSVIKRGHLDEIKNVVRISLSMSEERPSSSNALGGDVVDYGYSICTSSHDFQFIRLGNIADIIARDDQFHNNQVGIGLIMHAHIHSMTSFGDSAVYDPMKTLQDITLKSVHNAELEGWCYLLWWDHIDEIAVRHGIPASALVLGARAFAVLYVFPTSLP